MLWMYFSVQLIEITVFHRKKDKWMIIPDRAKLGMEILNAKHISDNGMQREISPFIHE